MNLKAILYSIYSRITADSESETDAEGYMSYRAEWHAGCWGFFTAFIAGFLFEFWIILASIGWLFTRATDSKVPEFVPYIDQLRHESLYVIAHAVAGLGAGVLSRIIIELGIMPSL